MVVVVVPSMKFALEDASQGNKAALIYSTLIDKIQAWIDHFFPIERKDPVTS